MEDLSGRRVMEKKFEREERGKKTRIKYMAGSGGWEGKSFCLSHKLKRRASTLGRMTSHACRRIRAI